MRKSLDILQGFKDISIDVEYLEDILYEKIFTLRYLIYIIRYLKQIDNHKISKQISNVIYRYRIIIYRYLWIPWLSNIDFG